MTENDLNDKIQKLDLVLLVGGYGSRITKINVTPRKKIVKSH